MGATLSTFDQNQGKTHSLEHKEVLARLMGGISKLNKLYVAESKTEFKRILTWTSTNLKAAQFNAEPSLWNIKTAKNKSFIVTSVETKADGIPYLTLESNSESAKIFVGSFEYLYKVLMIAGQLQLNEINDIVLGNDSFIHSKDIMSNVFGMSLDTASLIKVLDAMRNDMKGLTEHEKKLYRLYLIANSLDIEMMKESVQTSSKEKSLHLPRVEEEVTMIKDFCGKEDYCALLNISWDSAFVFSNSCKAPPWRQVFGDIGYIIVIPKDGARFVVTATHKGYFINKGYQKGETGKDMLNYDPETVDPKHFPSLIDLIKSRSTHFSNTIEKQSYKYMIENASSNNAVPNIPKLYNAISKTKNDTKVINEKQKNQPSEKKSDSPKKQTKKANHKKSDTTEPSSKWKALETVLKEEEDNSNHKKQNGASKKTPVDKRRQSALSGKKRTEVEDFSDSEHESGEEDHEEKRNGSDLPAEYYQIQKLVRYLRCGNETATVIAISALRDFDLFQDVNQYAIREVGGLETLINLLDTESVKCKIGALRILIDISRNVHIRNAIAELNGAQSLVDLLRDTEEEVKCLAAEAISHCAKNSRNRRGVRKYGGIKRLIKLLKSATESKEENAAIAGAMALATCSKSAKNKNAILEAEAIPILATLMESKNELLRIPLVALLSECATDERYRMEIRKAGMIKFLVEGTHSKNEQLQTHCASAIFKCAEDDEVRNIVRQHSGIAPLVALLDNTSNKELLIAATGAVWKCAQNLENVAAFNKLSTIKKLVKLMHDQPEEVLVNIVGALGACAKVADGRQAIRESGGIPPLANLLKGTNQNLLINVTIAVGECAHAESMNIIDRLDGVRLLWSLLKSTNPQVQASAAWAICPCIEQAKDAGEMVRSFVGGLELIVSLLKSDNVDVLSSICSTIAVIAKDEENLAVISDHGAVFMLSKLTNTKVDKLRKYLAEAVAQCCHWGSNRVAFGNAGAVAPLVKYLRSDDVGVHRSTAKALHQLSKDSDNCISMHEHGVVQLLLGMVGSTDTVLQESAAGTIGNIRRLALESENMAN